MKIEKNIFETHADFFNPTTTEMDLLKGEEPFVSFEIIPTTGISEGRQSRVSVLEYKTAHGANRVIWKRMGANKNLEKEEAVNFQKRLVPYQTDLIKHGWNLPNLFHAEAVSVGQEAQIFSYEELIPGGDCEKLITNPNEPNFKKWFALTKTMQTLANYSPQYLKREIIAEKELTAMPHGLDLKLANLVLRQDGKLFFVDLFAPKELNRNGSWRTYSQKLDTLPEDKLRAICATREGAILRFYRLAEQKWTQMDGIKKDALREGFLEILANNSLPKNEVQFIEKEISDEFPWLNNIYDNESKI